MFVKKIWQNYERLINAPKYPGKNVASIFAQAAGKNYDGEGDVCGGGSRRGTGRRCVGGALAATTPPWKVGPPPTPPHLTTTTMGAPPQPPPWKPGAPCLDNPQPSWERLQKQRPPLPLEDNHHHHLQQENPNLLHLGSLGSLESPHHKQPQAKPIKGNPEKIQLWTYGFSIDMLNCLLQGSGPLHKVN